MNIAHSSHVLIIVHLKNVIISADQRMTYFATTITRNWSTTSSDIPPISPLPQCGGNLTIRHIWLFLCGPRPLKSEHRLRTNGFAHFSRILFDDNWRQYCIRLAIYAICVLLNIPYHMISMISMLCRFHQYGTLFCGYHIWVCLQKKVLPRIQCFRR